MRNRLISWLSAPSSDSIFRTLFPDMRGFDESLLARSKTRVMRQRRVISHKSG